MKRLLYLLFLLLFQVSLHAGEVRYRVDTAYHHEDTATYTVQAAPALSFTPYEGTLRLGFTKGDTWIRLRIQARTIRVVPRCSGWGLIFWMI